MGLFTMLKGLPLTYNKDMQEDKEAVFDTVHTLLSCLELMSPLIQTMKCNRKKMFLAADDPIIAATDLADYLTKKGIPFREAHEIVGKMVLYCLSHQKKLSELSVSEMQTFHPLLEEDVLPKLTIEAMVEARKSFGGTAKPEVEARLITKREKLHSTKNWLSRDF
jgi:argininosuccinate lyase